MKKFNLSDMTYKDIEGLNNKEFIFLRVNLARLLLRFLWAQYDSAGHSCGRSACSGLLENAMNMIGSCDHDFSMTNDCSFEDVLRVAKDIYYIDTSRSIGYSWKDGGENHIDNLVEWENKLKKEIESGFENRFR